SFVLIRPNSSPNRWLLPPLPALPCSALHTAPGQATLTTTHGAQPTAGACMAAGPKPCTLKQVPTHTTCYYASKMGVGAMKVGHCNGAATSFRMAITSTYNWPSTT